MSDKKETTYRPRASCVICNGSGRTKDDQHDCPDCRGSGIHTKRRD